MSNQKEEYTQEMLAALIDLAYKNTKYEYIEKFLKYDLSPELLQKLYEMIVSNYSKTQGIPQLFKQLREKGNPMNLEKLFVIHQNNREWNIAIWGELLLLGKPKDKLAYIKYCGVKEKISGYIFQKVLSDLKLTEEELKSLLDSNYQYNLISVKMNLFFEYFFNNFTIPKSETKTEAEPKEVKTEEKTEVEPKEVKTEEKTEVEKEQLTELETTTEKKVPFYMKDYKERGLCFCRVASRIKAEDCIDGKKLLEYYLYKRCMWSLNRIKNLISGKIVSLDLKDKEILKLLRKLPEKDMCEIFETQLDA